MLAPILRLTCEEEVETIRFMEPKSAEAYEAVQRAAAALREAWESESHSSVEGVRRIGSAIADYNQQVERLAAFWSHEHSQGDRPPLSRLDAGGASPGDGDLPEQEIGSPGD